MSYSLRWYQSEACEAAWRFLCESPGSPVIDLPTGSGKSVVIAELCRTAVEQFGGRVIVLAHRKELLQQNADKIRSMLPFGITCGLHSAGLRRFATDDDVVVAGIQSVYRKASVFGARHLVLIDEVHLVPHDGEGMYRTFLNDLREINPKLRMIGLTATPFRTDCGALCRGDGLFQKVCFSAPIQRLIAEGYLCPLTNQPALESIDTSQLKIRGGEFVLGEMERAFDSRVLPAAREIVAKCTGRDSVLVFCSGVLHAQHVAQAIESLTGKQCGVVCQSTLSLERATLLERFKRRELRWLCNVDVLTTGFDAPCVDAVAILRATMSPGLFAQICGRGLRIHEAKTDCLLLDFGQNLQRHGPIDALDFGKDRQKSGTGEGPEKACPNCEATVPLSAASCECGWQFPKVKREPKHDDQADLQSQVLAKPEWWIVNECEAAVHVKRKDADAPPTLRLDYKCQPIGESGNISEQIVSEWVCFEHDGFARRKAEGWWKARSNTPVPASIEEALDLWRRGAVAMPTRISTIRDGRFFRIVEQRLDPIPETFDTASDFTSVPWEETESEEIPF